jgi:hypothetical protein
MPTRIAREARRCLDCRQEFFARPKETRRYCSRSCAARVAVGRTIQIVRDRMPRVGDDHQCPLCGAQVRITENRARQHRYACLECWAKRSRARRERKRVESRAYAKASYRRQSRRRIETLRRSRKRHPERERARRLLTKALRTGVLRSQPCAECGSPASQAHHEDYSKPLAVEWLCSVCQSRCRRKYA